MKWVSLGTKAAQVASPLHPGEQQYELRPCLKVAVHSLSAVDRESIAEAVVQSVEKRHGPGKRFSSEDHDVWLDFIVADHNAHPTELL